MPEISMTPARGWSQAEWIYLRRKALRLLADNPGAVFETAVTDRGDPLAAVLAEDGQMVEGWAKEKHQKTTTYIRSRERESGLQVTASGVLIELTGVRRFRPKLGSYRKTNKRRRKAVAG